jgi:fructan beta-fructosidase
MKRCIILLIWLWLFIVQSGLAQSMPEQHRPLFHFTPPAKWMNDPNGMVYYKSEYHLFYQYYPDSTVWGPMHWGHAVSKNLVDWQHLPIALYPDVNGCIFSGSAVVDVQNTSGFGQKGGEKPLVAIFTYHDFKGEKADRSDFQTQGIAYSTDRGRTWTKYTGNPVLKNPGIRDFRDPKVFWHEASGHWVMILAAKDRVHFYRSKDLKTWTFSSAFGEKEGAHGGVWECPDLFPMTVKGTKQTKWVLIGNIGGGAPNGGSGTQYFTGDFDGQVFKNDNPPDKILWFDYGKDNYAGVTWSDSPDGRRTLIGWMSNWQYAQVVPTGTWRSAMTLPRTLSLHATTEGLRLFQVPIKETQQLRGQKTTLSKTDIKTQQDIDRQSVAKEILLTFDLSATTASDVGVTLYNDRQEKVTIGYETGTKRFYIDRTQSGKTTFSEAFRVRQYAPRQSQNPILTLHLWIDIASVELFADEGSLAMTSIFFPNADFKNTALFAKNGVARLKKGVFYRVDGGR